MRVIWAKNACFWGILGRFLRGLESETGWRGCDGICKLLKLRVLDGGASQFHSFGAGNVVFFAQGGGVGVVRPRKLSARRGMGGPDALDGLGCGGCPGACGKASGAAGLAGDRGCDLFHWDDALSVSGDEFNSNCAPKGRYSMQILAAFLCDFGGGGDGGWGFWRGLSIQRSPYGNKYLTNVGQRSGRRSPLVRAASFFRAPRECQECAPSIRSSGPSRK